MTTFGDIFDDTLGHMRGDVHLGINKNAKPTVELERLTVKGAITTVQEPTDWISNMITTIKPDRSIRLCIDPYIPSQSRAEAKPLSSACDRGYST